MRLGRFSLVLACLMAIDLLSPAVVLAADGNQVINDVSWPNCNTVQTKLTDFGIVGVSGGLDFHNNPCLAKETSWFNRYGLYINTGYPGNLAAERHLNSPLHCNAANGSCLSQLVNSKSWWLDVETDNSWTANYLTNRENLEGALAALAQKTFLSQVGIYSSPAQWSDLTNNWNNLLPEWVGTGSASPIQAQNYCKGTSFTGGQIWLAQYTTKLDNNFICSSNFQKDLNNTNADYAQEPTNLSLLPISHKTYTL
jgi:hypothetical protein